MITKKLSNNLLTFITITSILLGCGRPSQKEIINDKLFNNIKSVTDSLTQFEGIAFMGNLKSNCRVTLLQGKKKKSVTEKIIALQYDAIDLPTNTKSKVKEIYEITNLVRKKQNKHKLELENPENYTNDYIEGTFKIKKSSTSKNNPTKFGKIIYVIDSINKKLRCIMASSGDYTYESDIKLTPENHLQIKDIFRDNVSSKEQHIILESYISPIRLISDHLTYVGKGKYKILLHEKDIIANSVSKKTSTGNILNETKKIRLFTSTIENISNDKYALIQTSNRFSNQNPLAKTSEQEILFWLTSDLDLFDGKIYRNVAPGDRIQFSFDVVFTPYKLEMIDNIVFPNKNQIAKLKPSELFKNKEFREILAEATKRPLFTFWGKKDRDSQIEIFNTEIYLEII